MIIVAILALIFYILFCIVTLFTLMYGLKMIVQTKNNIEPSIKIAKLPWQKDAEKKKVIHNAQELLKNG